MDKLNLPKYRLWWRNGLLLAYFMMLYGLHIYKYQMPSLSRQDAYSVNGKSVWIVGAYSLCCTILMIGILYLQTQNKGFVLFAGKLFGWLYVLLGGLFFIEKVISKTLLPDKLNSQVEMLVCYPFLLVFLLACHQMYALHEVKAGRQVYQK
jgi:hypothetical protein